MQTRNMERMFAPDRLVSITVTEEMFFHRTGNSISEHEFGEFVEKWARKIEDSVRGITVVKKNGRRGYEIVCIRARVANPDVIEKAMQEAQYQIHQELMPDE